MLYDEKHKMFHGLLIDFDALVWANWVNESDLAAGRAFE